MVHLQIVDMYKKITAQDDWSPLDKVFGAQRLYGTNPVVIQRVRSLERLQGRYIVVARVHWFQNRNSLNLR